MLAAGPSFQPPLADRRPAIYAVAADGRALPAADGTDALLAVDYGHYSVKGSVFAVRTILAPVIDAELAGLRKN